MLPLRFRRKDVDTLTWEYLDGEISPSRVQRLSRLLMEKVSARKRFVESAMMHGMLFEYYFCVFVQKLYNFPIRPCS